MTTRTTEQIYRAMINSNNDLRDAEIRVRDAERDRRNAVCCVEFQKREYDRALDAECKEREKAMAARTQGANKGKAIADTPPVQSVFLAVVKYDNADVITQIFLDLASAAEYAETYKERFNVSVFEFPIGGGDDTQARKIFDMHWKNGRKDAAPNATVIGVTTATFVPYEKDA